MIDNIRGNHHVTMSVGDAQSDFAFHVNVLGLRCVKKTIVFDGSAPFYHFYYGNGKGEASSILTTFPVRHHLGVKGRRGTNQYSSVNLSVPAGSLGWWADHLGALGVTYGQLDRFGTERLTLEHPSGIPFALVGTDDEDRQPWGEGAVPAEHAIRGTYGTTISLIDPEEMHDYLLLAFGGRHLTSEARHHRYEVGAPGRGGQIELVEDRVSRPGTWRFSEGTVHHTAWQVDDHEHQAVVKAHIEGLGYTDVSERKDRNYFQSVYTRSPSGAMFEVAVSAVDGFLKDEPFDELGTSMMLPPFLEDQRPVLVSQLEPEPALT